MPHLEGYLDNLLRGASDLYPAEPLFEGVIALIMPKRDPPKFYLYSPSNDF